MIQECSVRGCARPVEKDGLCNIHYMHSIWMNNSDPDNLGIVRFTHDLISHRFNKKYGVPQLHKEIYTDLLDAMDNGRNKMDRLHVIAAPREHSKSTIICLGYVLWCILFQKKKYIVIITESYDKSTQYIRAIKKALNTKEVRYYFGNVTAKYVENTDAKKWSEGHILTSTGITILALGAGKSARGLVEDTRPDLIIADDIESENNTKTEETRAATWRWWTAQVEPAADMINGQLIYIGTMVHYDCTLAKLIEQENGYRKRFYQVYTDSTYTQTIWPEKFPVELVKKIEQKYRNDPLQGVHLFYMEYMNIANNPEEKSFVQVELNWKILRNVKSMFLQYYDEIEKKTITNNVTISMGVDPASSLKSTAKYSAGIILATDYYGRHYVLDLYMARMPIVTDENGNIGLINKSINFMEEYNPEVLGWEMDGVGRPIGQALRLEMTKKNISTRFRELDAPHDQGKIDKIRNHLEPLFRAKKILQSPDDSPLKKAIEQFPKTRYLDILDALVNAVIVARPPREKIIWSDAENDRIDNFQNSYNKKKVRDWELP